jgi:OmpA-OmpF porin, OOP family
MKNNTLKLAPVFALLACTTLSASAFDDETTGLYVNAGINYADFDNDRAARDKDGVFFGLGYQATDHWGFELEYTEIDTSSHMSVPMTQELASFNSIYRQHTKGNSSVFWKIGVAQQSNDLPMSDDDLSARLGMGYDFALSNSFSFILGADAAFGHNNNPDIITYAGMSYFFGGKSAAKAPVKAPVKVNHDNDNDGVLNINDSCPNTLAGVKVGTNGCELDSDNDGVVNSKDQCLATPAGAKVGKDGCRIMLTEDVSIKLNVQFANNSNVVTAEYHQEIKKVADFMTKYPDTTTVIEGHTDSRGSAAYNQQLSQKRADAVMNYLVINFNIAQNRVKAIGKGEAEPIADNMYTAGRKQNRRVQAEITSSVTRAQ